jgi:hypothetical protein
MKHIPIFFNTAMVQAILEGRKIQTRRTKDLLHCDNYSTVEMVYNPELAKENNGEIISKQMQGLYASFNGGEWCVKCPYGQPGDILWVRETFKPSRFAGKKLDGYDYKADHVTWLQKNGNQFTKRSGCETGEVWKPSLFMPKAACRIFLQIKSIQVERLHKITNSSALAEGIDRTKGLVDLHFKDYSDKDGIYSKIFPIDSFRTLWQKINGPDSWNENPFVWVIDFEQIIKPENFTQSGNRLE